LPVLVAGQPATSQQIDDSQIQALFPKATRHRTQSQEDPPFLQCFYQLDELPGYAFESPMLLRSSGLLGQAYRLLIGMDPQGVLSGCHCR